MSSFWDNNREAILSGAAKGAKATGKLAWKGTKVVSKAGYQVAKSQAGSSSGGNGGANATVDDTPPELQGEARPLTALGPVSNLPPPPLKPGQMQYHSQKTREALSKSPLPLQQAPQHVPQQQYQQQYQQPVYQQAQSQGPPQIASRPMPSVPGAVQQLPQTLPQAQQQQPQPETITLPPAQVSINGTTVNIPSMNVDKQKAFNFAGQIASGMLQSQAQPPQQAQQPVQEQPVSQQAPVLTMSNPYYQGAVSQNVAAPTPAPPARTYDRAAAVIPQQVAYSEPVSATPSPNLSNLPVPPRQTGVQSPSATLQGYAVQSPVVSPSSIKEAVPIPTTKAGVVVGSGIDYSTLHSAKEKEAEEEEAAVIEKGISGTYDYKVDVKFAPPPKHMDMSRQATQNSLKNVSPAVKKSNIPPPPTSSRPLPPRAGSASPALSASSTGSGHAPAPPPPARTNTATSFPPPPKPTNPVTHQPNNFPPPPKPTDPHAQHSVSSLPPRPTPAMPDAVGDAPYTPTGSNSHEPLPPHPVSPPPPSRPTFDINKFAPPPRPFKKPEETSTPPPPRPEVKTTMPPLKPKPEIKPKPADLKSEVAKKAKPPAPGPKLSEKKLAPPVKPKPSFNNGSAPPPVKPKPTGLQGKIPPPIKPKPSALSEKPAVAKKPIGLNAVTSELNTHDNEVDKIESDEEDVEDNPFKRYLKAAVPSQDDRFH